MSEIQWTDETWNPSTGCTKISPGCLHCYIERTPPMRLASRKFVNGKIPLELHKDRLTKPLSWKKPRRIFVNSMSDLFHEDIPFSFIDRVMATMIIADWHTFQVLTKRPARMAEYFRERSIGDIVTAMNDECDLLERNSPAGATIDYGFAGRFSTAYRMSDVFVSGTRATISGRYHEPRAIPQIAMPDKWPLPNVWLGTSVEDQKRADERIPELLKIPAAVRFLSVEPMLGPVVFRENFADGSYRNSLTGQFHNLKMTGTNGHPDCIVSTIDENLPKIDWVIVGGESGPGSRPCRYEWLESIVDQCRAAATPVFVKQWGARPNVSYYDPMRDYWEGELGVEWPDALDWNLRDGQPPLDARCELKLADKKGGDPAEWPESIRVREFPAALKTA